MISVCTVYEIEIWIQTTRNKQWSRWNYWQSLPWKIFHHSFVLLSILFLTFCSFVYFFIWRMHRQRYDMCLYKTFGQFSRKVMNILFVVSFVRCQFTFLAWLISMSLKIFLDATSWNINKIQRVVQPFKFATVE